jgi:hypothetical protein
MAIGRSNIKQQITKAPAKKIKKKPKNNKLSMLNLSTDAQKRKARRP